MIMQAGLKEGRGQIENKKINGIKMKSSTKGKPFLEDVFS
jgi:hypothetical protein